MPARPASASPSMRSSRPALSRPTLDGVAYVLGSTLAALLAVLVLATWSGSRQVQPPTTPAPVAADVTAAPGGGDR